MPSSSPSAIATFRAPRAAVGARGEDGGRSTLLDRAAIGLSGLCLIHCVASAVFFASVASVGAVLSSPLFHEAGLVIAVIFAAIALTRGVLQHGMLLPFGVGCFGIGMMCGGLAGPHGANEVLATMAGVACVALAHDLNMRANRSEVKA